MSNDVGQLQFTVYLFEYQQPNCQIKHNEILQNGVKMFIGSNIQMSIANHSGGIFKHKTCTQRRKVCIENMVIVLQNKCTTKRMRIVLIVLTSWQQTSVNEISIAVR